MKEMSDQVRGIVFVVIVIVITFTWMHFFQPPVPPPQKPGQIAGQTTGQTAPGAGSAQPSAAAPGATQMAASAAPAVAPKIPTARATEEENIVVESTLYRVELSNHGGVVRSWKLKRYFDDQKPPRPLDLVNQDVAQELGWPLSLMLPDAQLEAQANSALYEVTPGSQNLAAPAEITFHFSDGHLDVTKKLKFTQDYQMSIEVTASLDGKPLAPAIAWRGGFGDKAVYKASQLVAVFYKQADSLSMLQYKKLGVSGNQIQPFQQPGSMQITGIEDQFFTAAFIPDGTDLGLWHWTQWHHFTGSDNQPASEPEAEIAVGATSAGPVKARIYRGPQGLGAAQQGAAVARRPREFRLDRSDRQAAAFRAAVAAPLHSQLGLGDRRPDAGDQFRRVSAEDEELAIHAGDAEDRAGNAPDPGQVQEVFDERPAQEGNAGRDGAALPAPRHQSHGATGRLPADAAADADLVGVVAGADGRDRAAARPVDLLDSGSFGEGSLLYFADRHGHHHVFDDQDDAAERGRGSGAAENDEADAADVRGDLFHVCKRLESLYVHEQPGRRGAAVLSEPDAAAAHEQPIQEKKKKQQ